MSANQNDPQYKLRWPSELREKIAESAKAHNRSMNADIIARLEQSLSQSSDDKISNLQNAFMRLHAQSVEQNSKISRYEQLLKEQTQASRELISKMIDTLNKPDE